MGCVCGTGDESKITTMVVYIIWYDSGLPLQTTFYFVKTKRNYVGGKVEWGGGGGRGLTYVVPMLKFSSRSFSSSAQSLPGYRENVYVSRED